MEISTHNLPPAKGWRDEDATHPKPEKSCSCGATDYTWYKPEQCWTCRLCGRYGPGEHPTKRESKAKFIAPVRPSPQSNLTKRGGQIPLKRERVQQKLVEGNDTPRPRPFVNWTQVRITLVALNRPVTVDDLTPELRLAAREYAFGYTGSFGFLVWAKERVKKSYALSDRQAKGVLNCLRAHYRRNRNVH